MYKQTLYLLIAWVINCFGQDTSRGTNYPGSLFWPPYSSHLLQSTKAQSLYFLVYSLKFILNLEQFCEILSIVFSTLIFI